MANRLLQRLREAVATSQLPQLQRGTELEESTLSAKDRKNLDKSSFAIPEKAPGSGSYPIPDESHARNALARVAQHGTADEQKRVKAAVKRKFPDIDLDSAKTKESVSFRVLIREAITKTGKTYEATIVREGPGNAEDRNYYTKQALREAVNNGMFEGLQAYANHPTPSEERERPERDVRHLVGHFREARYVDGNPAEVRAKFIPGGMDPSGVVALIESALASPKERPLIGISIDGYGHAPDQQEVNGRTYNMVREVTHLGSADIVTRAGAGGQFHRRLQEAWRNTTPAHGGQGHTSEEDGMKPAKLQEKIKAAAAKFQEAAGLKDDDEKADKLVTEAITELRECADAEIEPEVQVKIQEKIVEKPVAASDDDKDKLATKLREVEIERDTALGDAKKERKARKDAESKIAESDKGKLVAKVLRESGLPEKARHALVDDLMDEDDEQAMVAIVERQKAAREELLTELRESYGVEGAGPRQPSPAGSTTGGGLLERMGIDRDELAA